ncbi:MAG TPA: NAD(P)/FAD-dependent oxidoreductase [Papillibacter sp.]|jgi:thioredoxin reductase (NADPH)|nr:NAD(P)/FAD-dependent oxidoreductase [Papillibacter sp.]
MYDIVVIGSGPAGLSAAITAKMRNKSVAVVSNNRTDSGLYKAAKVDNYPGFPAVSGAELLNKFSMHAAGIGAEMIRGRVTSVLPMGNQFGVSYGAEMVSAKALVIATGVVQSSVFPGEEALLGSGVSYCATCDGMLYRGKKVCVVSLTPEAEEEAAFLESIGCEVVRLTTKKIVINGEHKVTSVTADGEEIPCEGVFILRPSIAPAMLVPGLLMADGHIQVDPKMRTNIPGVFAAGDCTGAPYQVAKAVGEGLVAVLSAVEYLAGSK